MGEAEKNSTWDWELLYYIARVIFHFTDEEFWEMRPKKFFSLLHQHNKVNSVEEKKTEPEPFMPEDLLLLR